MHKFGFESVIVYPALEGFDSIEADPVPMACSSKSEILKQSVIRVSLVPGAVLAVQADVLDVQKEFKLLDERNRPLPGFGAAVRPFWVLHAAARLMKQACLSGLGVCSGGYACLRRALARLCGTSTRVVHAKE